LSSCANDGGATDKSKRAMRKIEVRKFKTRVSWER